MPPSSEPDTPVPDLPPSPAPAGVASRDRGELRLVPLGPGVSLEPGVPLEPGVSLELAVPTAAVASPVQGRHVLVIGPARQDLLGHAARTLDLARHLAVQAASVTVLTGAGGSGADPMRSGEAAAAPDGGATVVQLDHGPRPDRGGQTTAATRSAYQASRLVTAACGAVPAPPDLVIATYPGLGGVMAAGRLARRHGAPLLVLVHQLLAGGTRVAPVGAALERRALGAADLVAVLSDSFVELLLGYGLARDRIVSLPVWADVPTVQRRAARLALGWPARGVQVVATDVGHGQDLATVIEAAGSARLRDDLDYLVVGDSGQRCGLGAQLGQLARRPRRSPRPAVSRVDLEADRLAEALAAADILLVAQDRGEAGSSGVSLSLLRRYLAAGRPVVVAAETTSPVGREAARSAGAAVLVPPADATALASAVAGLVERAPLRTVMSERALAYARATLDRTTALDQLDLTIAAAVARHPGPTG